QPLDQHGVVGDRLGPVDQRVEHLVVTRRGHAEQLANRLLLASGVSPPLALELEYRPVAGGQFRSNNGVARGWVRRCSAGGGFHARILRNRTPDGSTTGRQPSLPLRTKVSGAPMLVT